MKLFQNISVNGESYKNYLFVEKRKYIAINTKWWIYKSDNSKKQSFVKDIYFLRKRHKNDTLNKRKVAPKRFRLDAGKLIIRKVNENVRILTPNYEEMRKLLKMKF